MASFSRRLQGLEKGRVTQMTRPLIQSLVRPNSGCEQESEVEAKAELELARVERGGRDAVVATVAGALVPRVHVVEVRRGRGLVEAVEEVEALGNYLKLQALADWDGARDAHVERLVAVRQPHVAPEAARLEGPRQNQKAA